MDLKKLKKCKGLFCDQDWYETEDFLYTIQQPSWRFIRKTPVENSLNKTWAEQRIIINDQIDEVPFARQVIYTTFLYFFTTGERLFETRHVRTIDVDSYDSHVIVGRFDEDGLTILLKTDKYYVGDLGVSSARKVLNLES
jgi:hypothetical protein